MTNKGRYGYRRICLSLRNEGCNINHKTAEVDVSDGIESQAENATITPIKVRQERSHLMSLTGISQRKTKPEMDNGRVTGLYKG